MITFIKLWKKLLSLLNLSSDEIESTKPDIQQEENILDVWEDIDKTALPSIKIKNKDRDYER